MSDQMMEQAVRAVRGQGMSSIKEVVSGWSDVARYLRGGDSGSLVPVVIPKDKRGLGWTSLIWFGVWAILSGILGTQADEVAAAYAAQGFAVEERTDIGDWTTLVLRR